MPDTNVRRRPDLERMDVKLPGYIGGRIAPVLGKAQKSGTIYYQDIQADVTPQTSRTLGDAPTNAMVAAAKTTYDLGSGADERIERNSMGRSEIDQFGGLAKAEQVMARIGRRAVGEVREDLVVAACLAATQNADIGDSFIGAVSDAAATIEDQVPGLTALVLSAKIYNRICRFAEVADRMKFTGTPLTTIQDVRGVGPQTMAAMLGIDMVLIGPNSAWYTHSATYQDRAALVMIPEMAMPEDPRGELQTMRMVTLELEGTPEVLVESFYDSNTKRYSVDVQQWFELHTFNAEGIYTLKGIDEGNVVTTSTTTTA